MKTIAVVGCGFVGSLFTEEFLKLSFAGELQHRYIFIDGDAWEVRNAANQNVSLFVARQGQPKAMTLKDLALMYDREATAVVERVTKDNIESIIGNVDVIVDAVDNVATRQLLYTYGIQKEIPVLHFGLDAVMGTGQVEWSYHGPGGSHDTFALAPLNLLGREIPPDPESGVQPPCELVRMRAAGWHVSYAAAVSLAIYYGFDPHSHLYNEAPCHGYMTEWNSTPDSYSALRDTWSRIEVTDGIAV